MPGMNPNQDGALSNPSLQVLPYFIIQNMRLPARPWVPIKNGRAGHAECGCLAFHRYGSAPYHYVVCSIILLDGKNYLSCLSLISWNPRVFIQLPFIVVLFNPIWRALDVHTWDFFLFAPSQLLAGVLTVQERPLLFLFSILVLSWYRLMER